MSSQVLDSQPSALAPASKRLKRSPSSLSVASLPTPPRTISKRKRSRSRASSAFDSGDESDGSVSNRPTASKRRKIQDIVEEEAEEDAFWQGKSSNSKSSKPVVRLRTPSPTRSMSPEVQAHPTQKIGLVSPPPSRHQPARKVKKPATPKGDPSRKAKGKGKVGKEWPIRDSPNNPFLDDEGAPPGMKTPPRSKGPVEERPTLTYVFRGQKQEIVNPLYKCKPQPNSLLPPEHPDFSPSAACPPKLLFPNAHRRLQSRDKRGRSPSPFSDVEQDDDVAQDDKISPMGRLTFETKDVPEERTLHTEIESQKGRRKRVRI